jgi:hypothetical protein
VGDFALPEERTMAELKTKKTDASVATFLEKSFATRDSLMKKVGKLKTGVSCLYVKRLADLDLKVLKQLVKDGVAHMKATYPTKF